MNDFFKKLNVLIKASLNDVVSSGEDAPHPRVRLSKNVEDEIKALRERVNDAVRYEDEIKARIRQFEDEAVRWDQQADEAVGQGRDEAARYAVVQMQRAQQRATVAQSDLREHQRSTEELIQRVNMLDAVVAEARRSEPAPDNAPDLGNVLRATREKIASLAETAAAATAAASDAQSDLTPEAPTSSDPAAVDDDLEQRRQRLSKR